MAAIEYTDDRDSDTARKATVYDQWVVAMVETDNDELKRLCIPREQIREIDGVSSGDDIDIDI